MKLLAQTYRRSEIDKIKSIGILVFRKVTTSSFHKPCLSSKVGIAGPLALSTATGGNSGTVLGQEKLNRGASLYPTIQRMSGVRS